MQDCLACAMSCSMRGLPLTFWNDPDRVQCLKQRLCWRRVVRPAPAPLTTAAVQADGAYLMDCGRVFVMWLGRSISPEFMTQASSIAVQGGRQTIGSHS